MRAYGRALGGHPTEEQGNPHLPSSRKGEANPEDVRDPSSPSEELLWVEKKWHYREGVPLLAAGK